MLQELTIRNFAIIEDLTIRFEAGLTVLSGETGAGKSIIINAVNLLLGSRASSALIRTGAENAELEALFDIPPESAAARIMAEQDHDAGEGLMIRRIISRNERHRIYINGRLATMQALGAITAQLASISGQHAHQGLLREDVHLEILDQYGDLLELRRDYAEGFGRLQPLLRREQDLLRRQAQQGQQLELLRFQWEEIAAAALTLGEDETLEQERRRLKNGEFLYQTVQQGIDLLYSGDGAVVEQLGGLGKSLEQAAAIDAGLAAGASALNDLAYGVEDLAAQLRDYLKRIDLDPRNLENVEARLDQLTKLKRKYGGSLESVLAHQDDVARQLEETENIDAAIAEVSVQLKQQHRRLTELADQLNAGRRQAAQRLSRLVEAELASLKMADTRFAVDLQAIPASRESNPFLSHAGRALTETGMDRAAFMIAPNVGEAIKPLASIASGGELSRVVLALKAILAQRDSVETVIFDEVDAGIGGGVAELVGKKLAALARHHQILCITHLPQIAKYGRYHFRIVKSVVKGRTLTTMAPLGPEARIEEIARMLGGETITPATLNHAREMLAS
jgi:DNA repair protein RecN (Recombination protein N)